MKSRLGLVLLIASMFAQHTPNQTMFCLTRCTMASAWLLPAGAQLAVLEGDPTASSGDFAVRLVQSFVTSLAVGEHARQLKISC